MVALQTGYATAFTVIYNICDVDIVWNSSLQLPNGMYLIIMRVVHLQFTSGKIPSQLERFSDCLGAMTLGKNKQTFVDVYSEVVAAERQLSCENAISIMQAIESPEGIDIITHARHSTRRNSKLIDVVCKGYKTHKVIDHEIVSPADVNCAQRHGPKGTKQLYKRLDSKHIGVRRHGHDRHDVQTSFCVKEATDNKSK